MTKRQPKSPNLTTLLSGSVALGTLMLVLSAPLSPAQALPQADSSTAADLVRQGDFWRARGRTDLANQAYGRALRIDPNNAAARRGLAGNRTATPPAAPTPAQATAPATGQAQVQTQAQAPAQSPRPSARSSANRAPAQKSAADRAGEVRLSGYAALERGELATAASRFEQVLQSNPRDADALGGLGIVRLRQDRFAEARDLLERASQSGNAARWTEALTSARFFAGLEQAQTQLDSGDSAGAQRRLTELLTTDIGAEQKAVAAVQLGDLLMDQGRYGEAREAFALAEGHESQVPYKLAHAEAAEAAATGDPIRAENAWRRALERGGANDPWLRHGFASFLLDQGRTSDAAAIIQPLEASTSAESLYAAALFYSQAERPAEALRLIRRVPTSGRTPQLQALETEIGLADAERQARTLAASGRQLAAMELLARYDVPSASQGQKLRLAGAYYALGATDRAGVLARSAAEQPVNSSAQQENLVRLLAQTGQDDLALSVIERATGGVRTSPTATRLYSTLAVSSADRLREQGLQAEAFEVLQSGWSLAPQDPSILISLGRLYQSGEMNEEAAQVFEMALARKANDVDALKGLAEASAARRDFTLAREAYQRLLRQEPENVEAYLTAARIEQAAGDRRAARRLLEQAEALGSTRTLASGSAFAVNNPFRNTSGVNAPVQANPFAPETLRASGRGSALGGTLSGRDSLVRTPVQQALAELDSQSAPRVTGDIEARVRSGEAGLSNLNALTATVKASTPMAGGHLGLSLQPTVVDAGDQNRSARARFGRNATAEALAIVAQEPAVLALADSQYAAGVALSAFYEGETFSADIGTTPMGFEKTKTQGGVSWNPRLGQHGSVRLFGERRPVTDSVLSYAGSIDPVSGRHWGAVMKSGGGLGASWERDGTGLYGDASYHVYQGTAVVENSAIQMNLGAYQQVYEGDNISLNAGLKLNYQAFDKNQSYFTVGHGGYFSPQNFISLALPLSARWQEKDWSVFAELSPGYQTYKQDAAAVYPNDPTAQGQLLALKLLNDDVRAQYDSESHSGFAFSGGLEVWRNLGTTAIGGEARMNTFGNYDEYRMTLRLKQAFGFQP